MKRSIWFCLAVLVLAGCNESAEYTCGNGKLESDEICDGTLFSSDLYVVCSNGMTANTAALKCNAMCKLDTTAACSGTCGNGVIEGDEECDGMAIPAVTANCTNPDMTKLQCVSCKLVDNGICPDKSDTPQPTPTTGKCGNGVLDDDEMCDGELIRESAKSCPVNMKKKAGAVFKCMDSCRVVDLRDACEYSAPAVCGDGVRQAGEDCDGTEFSEDALNEIVCSDTEKLDTSKAVCSADCKIQNACVPKVNTNVGLLISEVVPHFVTTSTSMAIDGLAVELTNMSEQAYDVSACSLALISESGVEKKYPLSSLGYSSLIGMETTVICSQSRADKFNGACNQVISEDGILDNMSGKAFLGIVCGAQDSVVDLFNLNSFLAAIQNYGVDFQRLCDAEPSKTADTALLGSGWYIDSATTDAPVYGLGEHCSNVDASVSSCTYTVSRNELTDRGQSIELALEIKIPGISDLTNKTDDSAGTQITFLTGKVNGNKVTEEIIHLVNAKPDTAWVNENGVDRYIGTLRNWDTYEGFLSYENGTYVLDASISFDKGQTRIFCGPKGQIYNYSVYDPSARNTLVVSYDDDGGTCGDGILSSSEVCDGSLVREEALECETPGESVYDKTQLYCTCSMLSTVKACAAVPPTCGNGALDDGELCDGSILPDSAKVCPSGMISIASPVWECSNTCLAINPSLACEYSCGNGVVDEAFGEVCDGSNIPASAKVCPKNYVEKTDSVWSCDASCKSVKSDNACELACGNGKIDNGEACDGTMIDQTAAAAKCKSGTTYDASRASCLDGCTLDNAACIPDVGIVFDEFIVKNDDNGKPAAVAISINNYGAPTDIAGCNLSLLNTKGSFAIKEAYYFSFGQIANFETSSYELAVCKPLIICSEPLKKSEYKNYFNDGCDAVLSGYNEDGSVANTLLFDYPELDTLQISCNDVKIDYFDMDGFRAALNAGYTHGKLKSSDHRPWSGRTTSDLAKRMDFDKSSDMSSFAKPVCE